MNLNRQAAHHAKFSGRQALGVGGKLQESAANFEALAAWQV
jgi:hypothetical protein